MSRRQRLASAALGALAAVLWIAGMAACGLAGSATPSAAPAAGATAPLPAATEAAAATEVATAVPAPALIPIATAQIAEPGEALEGYVRSAELQTYAAGTSQAEVAALRGQSAGGAQELVLQVRGLLEAQGFAPAGQEGGVEIYSRQVDPWLRVESPEYVELLLVGQTLLMARGPDAELVHLALLQARESAGP